MVFDGQYRKDVSSKKLNNILKIEFTDFNKGQNLLKNGWRQMLN